MVHQIPNVIRLNRQIKDVLRKSGLSEREIEIFILLNKKGPQKGTDIARHFKLHRGQVYRILKGLERKSFVEATLERPKMFIAVPLKDVIDSFIKLKKEEVARIESSKEDLFADWEKIGDELIELSSEKFSVIEGNKRILNKMLQMLEGTKNCFSVALSVGQILRADQYGVFDQSFLNSGSKIKFRILTQISKKTLKATKVLHRELQHLEGLKGLDTNLGPSKFSKMVIRDNDEIAFFISKEGVNPKNETILCTNSKSIVNAFLKVFEDFWSNSIDITQQISEIESGRLPINTQILKEPEVTRKIYFEALNQAKKEILIVTTARGLTGLATNTNLVKTWFNKGISLKILAPITNENLAAAQILMKFCEVKHIPVGYTVMTIVDNQKLFQFNCLAQEQNTNNEILNWKYVFFTNNIEYILKAKNLLFDIWSKTHVPLSLLKEVTYRNRTFKEITISEKPFKGLLNKRKTNSQLNIDNSSKITEKQVLEKISTVKKNKSKPRNASWTDKIIRFGKAALAVINLPSEFNIPKFLIAVVKHDKDSTFGAENTLMIQLWIESSQGFTYMPVAYVQDNPNPNSIKYRKKQFEGFPIGKNIQVVEKEQLQVLVQGTTFFVGWTKPILLLKPKCSLPPCCMLFEGFGNLNSGVIKNTHSSGIMQELWHNSYDAFVTFFHPKSKYSGSGTEGIIDVDSVFLSYPPKSK